MSPLSPSQRAALTATARVAGLAGLALSVACGPKQPAATTSTAVAAPTEQPAPSTDDAVVTQAEPLTLETCEALTAEALSGVQFGANAPKNLDPTVLPCCELVLAEMESTGRVSGEARWGCCALTRSATMACTPWGPPSPPAMV
jgi:hypothetical protein